MVNPSSIHFDKKRSTYCLVISCTDGVVNVQYFTATESTAMIKEADFNKRMVAATANEVCDLTAAQPKLQAMQLNATKRNIASMLGRAPLPKVAHATAERKSTTKSEDAPVDVGRLHTPTDADSFERLVLWPDCVYEIKAAVSSILKRSALNVRFGLDKIQPYSGRSTINLYGESGCGKTACARAIAHQLQKPIYQVSYEAIVSKWVGDTPKHIKMAFDAATKHEAILFLDEADSLVSRRTSSDDASSTHVNQSRTALMQSMDTFDGIVLLTTNLFENYDTAILRRIARHVHVKPPDHGMRVRIFDTLLPVKDFVERSIDWDAISDAAEGMTGGDILNVVTTAIEYASVESDNSDDWWVTAEIMLHAVGRIADSKKAHSG